MDAERKADEETAADLAYIRQLTEEARGAPLLGGRYLIMWGTLVAGAFAWQWGILSGAVNLPAISLLFLWGAFGLLGGAGSALLTRSLHRKPGRFAPASVVERAAWRGTGIAIGAFAGSVFVASGVLGQSPILFDAIVAVAFCLYGTAFLSTAAASKRAWMRAPAALAFTGAGLVPFLAGSASLYLVASVVVILTAVAPGIVLMLNEPGAVEEAR